MVEFSGSFFSNHYFQAPSFLVIESGRSLKTGIGSPTGPKFCLERAIILSHILSLMKERGGLLLSFLISKEAPAFKNMEMSLEEIILAVV